MFFIKYFGLYTSFFLQKILLEQFGTLQSNLWEKLWVYQTLDSIFEMFML